MILICILCLWRAWQEHQDTEETRDQEETQLVPFLYAVYWGLSAWAPGQYSLPGVFGFVVYIFYVSQIKCFGVHFVLEKCAL